MKTARRQLVFTAIAGLLLLVVVDGILSLARIPERLFASHKPLPPFGALTNPHQREWLERQKRELAAGAESPSLVRFDTELGWDIRPGYASEDGHEHSNARGQRGVREYAERCPPGHVRLACYGDSFTWCPEVRDAWSWPAILEAEHADYEALNLGVPAFGTGQALLRFRREGRHDAHVVCIGIMLENICRNVNRYRPLYHPMAITPVAKPRFALGAEGLEVVPLPFRTRREFVESVASGEVIAQLREHEFWSGPRLPAPLKWSFLVRLSAGWLAYRERNARRQWADTQSEPFQVTLAILETFHREALASGARAAPVLIFVGPWEIEELARGDRYHGTLLDALTQRGVPFLDLTAPLAAALDGPEAEELFAGYHLGRAGNALVAREVQAWVESELGSAAAR